jgi:hypothetical protein
MTIARIGRNRSPFYGQAAARAEREAEAVAALDLKERGLKREARNV